MLRKMMLAGLMTATVLGGVAPAYAQRGDDGRGRGGPQAGQMQRNQPQRNWQGGGEMRQQRPQVQQPQAQQPQRWQQAQRPVTEARPDRRAQANGPATVTRWNQNERRFETTVRNDGRNDRRNDRNWNDRDRRDRDGRWNNGDRRGWTGNNWNNGRRYDDRSRWEGQRRWDNGWRQDRRYDWQSYRSRYADRYRVGRYYAPQGWNYGYSRFGIGIFLNNMLYANNYWINDPYSYRLPPSYGTLRWIRYYDDAMLVDIRDGYVVDVIHDFFW